MQWRDMADGERAVVERLILALYEEDPAGEPMTREKIARTLRVLAEQPLRGRAVVLDVAGAVEGYALLCAFWSNELGGEVCIVDELYVAAACRGRGAASALMRAIVDGAVPWFQDAVAVELEVTPGNARARALYERLGFRAYKNALMRRTRSGS